MTKKILSAIIADDHSMVRSGIRLFLQELGKVEVIQEVENGLEAIAAVKIHQPDIIILDINMPIANGVEVVAEILRWSKQTRIVVYSGISSAQIYADLIAAGVAAIVQKKDPPAEFEKCINRVIQHKTYHSPSVLSIAESAKQAISLSAREYQILQHIALGQSNTQISEHLSISPKTVDSHRSNLMRKFETHSVAELIRKAIESNLLDTPEI